MPFMAGLLLWRTAVEHLRDPFGSRGVTAKVRCSSVALVLCLGASVATAQTATPQAAAPCVQQPLQATTRVDVTSGDTAFAHGTFSIQLPDVATEIQQVSVRIAGARLGGFALRNLSATIQLKNVSIEHGIDVPNNPFLQSNSFAATLSRQTTFYADAGSHAIFDADFTSALPHDIRRVDVSIVGLTRSAGCATIP